MSESAASEALSAEQSVNRLSRLGEIFSAFGKLGCISFGGPVAHLGYFRNEFVTRRKWLDDSSYGDLVALCQFLPGPASSQVVFGLGMMRGGLPGAILASLCFTMPSAIIMIGFAYGVAAVGDLHGAGWLHGLKLAAVAVVAQAVFGMGRNLCPDLPRILICIIAAAVLIFYPAALIQIGVLAAGALLGWMLFRSSSISTPASSIDKRGSHLAAGATLGVFFLLLAILPAIATNVDSKPLKLADAFYRSGSLVFGGGHVVLPLLRAEVVPHWINDDQFLAGYGAAQAVPGPLFTFSAYLGTTIFAGTHPWLGGLLCLFAIFLPAWLLIGGALPFWHSLRSKAWAQAALKGANATVVGMLLAALYRPVITESITGTLDVLAAVIAFAALQFVKVPPLIVVVLMAAAGQWLLK